MSVDPSAVIAALVSLVVEDRNEARIWRARLEYLASGALIASYTISAACIGKKIKVDAAQLAIFTVLVDVCLAAVMTIFFFPFRKSLTELRRSQAYRQDLFVQAVNGKLSVFDPFKNLSGVKPGSKKAKSVTPAKGKQDRKEPEPAILEFIKDGDMDLLFALTMGLILAKMVLLVCWSPVLVNL